ncbi:hypothetical protein R4K52_09475 [Brachyspira pilosicoli]|uniref:hypothetical protein n=1 Tax=Brachyspira pilosicoli TaxID=52584 RepID=UPI0030055678
MWFTIKLIIAIPIIFLLIIAASYLLGFGETLFEFISDYSPIVLKIVALIAIILCIIGILKFVF